MTAAQPHSGLVVVAAGTGVGGRVRLIACPDGTAILYPLGLTVRVATASLAADHLVDLLANTAARGTDVPVEAAGTSCAGSSEPAEPEESGASEHSEEPSDEDLPDAEHSTEDELPAEPAATVRVLGPVEITWQGSTPKRQVAELVSYLAVHPRGITYDQGRLAMWPATADDDRFGERAPATFWSLTTRARGALGKDRDGNALILREGNTALRLSAEVSCDWTVFERLASAARADRDRAPTLLRRALSLVRGRPFQDAAWTWVEAERLDGAIEAAVADAACDLADLALDASDLDTARFAVNQGLLAVPQSEALLRAAMRVAATAGDRDAVERAWRDARRLAASLGSLGEPEPETVALYQSLRQRNGDA
jgi:DNA-binding SARP family transcriptional activator